MIPRENILLRLDDYLSLEHPELLLEWKEIHMPPFVEEMRKYHFITLEEALGRYSVLNFSHNSIAHMDMSFQDALRTFGVDDERIPSDDGEKGTFSTGFPDVSKYSYFMNMSPMHFANNYYYRFLEGVFGLSHSTFKSAIVEPGYGLRLDRNGQISSIAARIIDGKIPLLVDTVDIGKCNGDRAYIVNGFDV